MAERQLKLYVWEDVFEGYWPGIAFALAYDVRQARKLVTDQYAGQSPALRASAARELAAEPKIIHPGTAKPQAWQLSGGD